MNREKCQIAVEELTFLGDRLTANELKPDPAKVKPIVEFTTPKEQDVTRFLDMVFEFNTSISHESAKTRGGRLTKP